jgi:hypothetical protein
MKNITGALVLLQFLVIVMGILVSFFSALYRGGGEIPREWRPENEEVRAPTAPRCKQSQTLCNAVNRVDRDRSYQAV